MKKETYSIYFGATKPPGAPTGLRAGDSRQAEPAHVLSGPWQEIVDAPSRKKVGCWTTRSDESVGSDSPWENWRSDKHRGRFERWRSREKGLGGGGRAWRGGGGGWGEGGEERGGGWGEMWDVPRWG